MNEEINYINRDKISDFAYDYTKEFLVNECHFAEDKVVKALLNINNYPTLSRLFEKVCEKMIDVLTYSREESPSLKETIKVYCIALSNDLKKEFETL